MVVFLSYVTISPFNSYSFLLKEILYPLTATDLSKPASFRHLKLNLSEMSFFMPHFIDLACFPRFLYLEGHYGRLEGSHQLPPPCWEGIAGLITMPWCVCMIQYTCHIYKFYTVNNVAQSVTFYLSIHLLIVFPLWGSFPDEHQYSLRTVDN